MLYKCLGIVLRKSGKREVVSKQLNNIFTTVKHSDQEQREVIWKFFSLFITSFLIITERTKYSGTPVMRPQLLPHKNGHMRGVVVCQGHELF